MRNSIDQITNVITLLAKKPTSRRAVIQLFNAEDIDRPHVEVPCTTTMQFFIRDEKVHMCTTMRSNDAYLGLPHDVFCFTMIQEMIANKLEKGLGEYVHFVGSMHLYTDDIPKLAKYIGEGYHKLAEMPAMPEGNPFELVPTLLAAEDRARRGEVFDALSLLDDPYWADLVRLLQAFWARGQNDRLDQLSAELHHRIYQPYLESRRGKPGHQNDGNAA
jgi:thymidylate synthase